MKLSNISHDKYRKILKSLNCKCNRSKGDHEHWSRADLNRPLTFQSTINPVPEFIIKQHLRYLNLSREEFQDIYNNHGFSRHYLTVLRYFH